MLKDIGSFVVRTSARCLSSLCVSHSGEPKRRAVGELAHGIELGMGATVLCPGWMKILPKRLFFLIYGLIQIWLSSCKDK